MQVRPRAEILALEPPAHGAVHRADLEQRGLPVQDVLDFSASLSPLGPPASVLAAARNADLVRYPDPQVRELRRALAEQLQVPTECLLVGNGASELILLAALAHLAPEDPVLVIGPTYGEYAHACKAAGAKVSSFVARPQKRFQLDLGDLSETLRRTSPRLTFLCNPNNPTGAYLRREQILSLIEATEGLVIVDEAYLDFVQDADSLLDLGVSSRLLLIRSLTKTFALAGLRLGYVVGGAEPIEAMRKLQPPWSVNSVAQAAGHAALNEFDYVFRARAAVTEARDYLQAELSSMGLKPVESAANFVLVEVGDASSLCRRLLTRGLAVRDCASFGLPECIRIGIRSIEDCQRLTAALRQELNGAIPA